MSTVFSVTTMWMCDMRGERLGVAVDDEQLAQRGPCPVCLYPLGSTVWWQRGRRTDWRPLSRASALPSTVDRAIIRIASSHITLYGSTVSVPHQGHTVDYSDPGRMGGGRAGRDNHDDKGRRSAMDEYDHEGITTTSSGSDTDLVKVNLAAAPSSPSPSPSRPAAASTTSTSASGSASASSTSTSTSTSPQLVYAKSKVYIHPSSYSRDNVPGWITIVKRGKRDFLLSWIPESLLTDDDKERYIRVEIEEATGNLHMTDGGLARQQSQC